MPKVDMIDDAEAAAYLLTIVEVDKRDRVQCQAEGCGHSVYKRIHVVLVGTEFKVLGSQCYQRLYGHRNAAAATPLYGSENGRLLSDGERLVLVENTARFIEALEAERVEALEAERVEAERLAALDAARRQQEAERATWRPQIPTRQVAPPLPPPQHVPDDERSPTYDGPDMLRWRWRPGDVCAACVAAYQARPSSGPHHATVMQCFQRAAQATPYLFALDVELKQRLPKRYILRALDELHLIERT